MNPNTPITERLLSERLDRAYSPDPSQRDTSLSQGTSNTSQSFYSHTNTTSKLLNVNRMSSLNNIDISNQQSTKKNIKQDNGDYYWADFESKWTVLDQKRLVSMDYLCHRSLEFHNNHHTFRASGNYDYSIEMGPPLLSDYAMEVQKFHPDDETAPASHLLHFGELQKGHLSQFKVEASSGVYWFHLKDIRGLNFLASHVQMAPLAVSLFYDLRGRSTISALDDGLFISFCIVTLNGNDAELHKVYCYCTQSYMITFERELIIEPEEDDSTARLASTYRSPLSFDDYDNSPSASPFSTSGTRSVDKTRKLSRGRSMGYEAPVDTSLSILSFLFIRMRTELFSQASKLGTMYMLYEVGMESLSHSDTMIEFVSRTIFYLKQQVHKKLTHTQKLHFHRKVHILLAGLHLTDCLINETYINLEKIFNRNSSQFSALLLRYEFSNDHLAFMALLVDSYEFTSTCLERQIEDVNSLESVMGHISAIRAEKVSTNLSLIATVFLPVTFLASAFGMNFEKNGDYTMSILNSPQGPNIFYAMCIIVIVLNLIAFLHSGLVTIRDTEAIIRPKPTNYGNESSSKFMSCFSAPVSRQNSRASSASISHIDNHYPDIHGSSHSAKSLKSTINDRSSLYNSNGDLAKMGADLERLDRDSLDDQSLVEEFRRQNISKTMRNYAAAKKN